MKKNQIVLGLLLLTSGLVAEPVKPPIHVFPIKPPVLDPGILKKTHHLSATDFASEVDRLLASARMKLNNHQSQSSYVSLQGVQFSFQIPRTSVDLDCGVLCPDVGNGYFYVNDVNLERADFRLRSGYFELSLDFEDSGREIKGYHSVLGDSGMPDFQMDRPLLKIKAAPTVVSGQMSLAFSGANLSADIESTGGCNIAGIDICNKIFGTDRKIEKGVETASQNAMNAGLIQNALRFAIRQYLQSRGVNGTIRAVRLVGNDLQVTIQ